MGKARRDLEIIINQSWNLMENRLGLGSDEKWEGILPLKVSGILDRFPVDLY